MKLVKFSNGSYGVRHLWFFGWFFIDTVNEQYQWQQGSRFFRDCQTNRERAEKVLQNRKAGEPPYHLVDD